MSPELHNPRSFRGCLVAAFLLAAAVAFFYPVLLTGHTFYAFDNLFHYLPWSSLAPAPNFIGHNPLISDPVNQHYLSYQYLKECMTDWSLPLWYDSILCGLPHVLGFTPQINPVVFLAHVLLPVTTAHNLILFLFMFGTGLFMYLYLRQIGLRVLPATAGAVCWMFNGTLMVWLEFEFWIILSCTLAASLFFVERWFHTRRTLDALFFITSVCMAITGGMVHLLIYQLLFTTVYVLYRYFSLRRPPAQIAPASVSDFSMLLLAILMGAAISGPLLTSYLAFQGDPQRPSFDFQDLIRNTGQLHPAYLATLIFPDLFGNPAGSSHISFVPNAFSTQVYNNYNELCIYAGVLPLFLALANRPSRERRFPILLFSVCAILSLAMAMGTFFYYPLARFIPGLGYSTPTRILYIFGFSLSVLAATGAHQLQQGILRKKRGVLIAWSSLFLVVIGIYQAAQNETVVRWMLSLTKWKEWESSLPSMKAYLTPWSNALLEPVIISGAVFLSLFFCLRTRTAKARSVFLTVATLLLVLDLMSFGRHYNTISPKTLAFPSTEGIRFLQRDRSIFRVMTYGKFLHNTLSAYGIDDIGGYTSLYPKRYGEFLHLSQYGPKAPLPDYFSRWTFFGSFGSPLLDLLNTKYLLLPPGSKVDGSGLKPVFEGEITIYENEKVFPRAFFVPGYHLAPSRKEAYESLGRFTSEDFRSKVILEKRPISPSTANALAQTEDSSATVTTLSHKPDRVEIQVITKGGGFLVLSDSYDAGWRAQVNGRRAEVLRANYIMRAVPLEAGTHDVVLSFRPRLQIAGLVAGVAGWIVLCASIAILMLRRRLHVRRLL